MPAWIHERAERLEPEMRKTYGPKKAKEVAFATATQQAYAAGKAPKKWRGKRFGTSEGRREAKEKYDMPKKEYQKKAADLAFQVLRKVSAEKLALSDERRRTIKRRALIGAGIGGGLEAAGQGLRLAGTGLQKGTLRRAAIGIPLAAGIGAGIGALSGRFGRTPRQLAALKRLEAEEIEEKAAEVVRQALRKVSAGRGLGPGRGQGPGAAHGPGAGLQLGPSRSIGPGRGLMKQVRGPISLTEEQMKELRACQARMGRSPDSPLTEDVLREFLKGKKKQVVRASKQASMAELALAKVASRSQDPAMVEGAACLLDEMQKMAQPGAAAARMRMGARARAAAAARAARARVAAQAQAGAAPRGSFFRRVGEGLQRGVRGIGRRLSPPGSFSRRHPVLSTAGLLGGLGAYALAPGGSFFPSSGGGGTPTPLNPSPYWDPEAQGYPADARGYPTGPAPSGAPNRAPGVLGGPAAPPSLTPEAVGRSARTAPPTVVP